MNRLGHEMRRTPRTPALVTATLLLAAAVPNASEAALGRNAAVVSGKADLRIRAETIVLPPPIATRLAWARSHLAPSGLRRLEQIGWRLAPDVAARTALGPLRARAQREVIASFPGLGGAAVGGAAFIVLAAATEDMDDEMRTILAEGDSATKAKEKLRDMIAALDAWIAREMSQHSEAGDLDNQTPILGGPAPTPAVLPWPRSLVTFEMRTSPVAGIRYLRVDAVPPPPTRLSAPTLGEVRALRDANVTRLAELERLSADVVAGLRRLLDYRSNLISELSNLMAKMATTQDTLVQNIR